MDPALVRPEGHHASQREGRGDGRALKVLRFSGCVLGEHGDGDVEAGEAEEAAEDEEGEEDVVGWRAHAEGEGGGGGGDAEGYLWGLVSDSISFGKGSSSILLL